ncbi:tripartite motif-containing protein 2-like [Anneissia japonica]|uniref:tripartite motif-containing protein 2-like n=1 Tax=Anneissia japonica TaxID=1529436 RepID=UPI0014259381|nr:tripartite motif-containing protein 2-like [Anneissia japonica]
MSESLSSLLECPLCFESFNNRERLPKMLSCQHTACLECLHKIVGKRTNFVCPTCRSEYKVPDDGVKALANNLTIISMMQHVTQKQRRLSQIKVFNVQALKRSLLSKIQSLNFKLSKLDPIAEVISSKCQDQKSMLKSIDDCFQRIYLGLEKRREILRSDVNAYFEIVNDALLKVSTIEETKRKVVTFCSTAVDLMEGSNDPSAKELTSLLQTATDFLPTIEELNRRIMDVNSSVKGSKESIVFSNVMEESLVSQINYLGRIQDQNMHESTTAPSPNIIEKFIQPTKDIATEPNEAVSKPSDDVVKKVGQIEQTKENGHVHLETNGINEAKGRPWDHVAESGGEAEVVQKLSALKVVLNERPVNYKWSDEEPLTFGLRYFNTLEEGPLDLALIRNGTTKQLAVTTEFSQTISVFDEKLYLKKPLGEPWFGHVRGLCTDDRGRLVAVTNIGDVLLFDNCSTERVKRIYSVYQGAIHSDYASTKCGIAISSRRILYLGNDGDGCVDAIRGKNGKLIRKIGKNRCMEPRGIALTSDERILIADARNHCVWLYAKDGQCVRKYGRQGKNIGELSEPWGVDVDKDGNVVVADTGNHRIQIFDKGGASLATIGEHGSLTGQFDWPMSVTVTINRKIIVCDSGNYRIQIL